MTTTTYHCPYKNERGPYLTKHGNYELVPVITSTIPGFRDLAQIIAEYDGRIDYYNVFVPPTKTLRKVPLYLAPLNVTRRVIPMMAGTHTRSSRSTKTVLLIGERTHFRSRLRKFFARGDDPFPKQCKIFQPTHGTKFQDREYVVGQKLSLSTDDGPLFTSPIPAINVWQESRLTSAARLRSADYWNQRPHEQMYSGNMIFGRKYRGERKVHAQTPFDVLIVHCFDTDLTNTVTPLYNTSGTETYRPFIEGVGRLRLRDGLVFESTVSWQGIINIDYCGSTACPYGTFSEYDYIRLVVVKTTVLVINKTVLGKRNRD
jgi:hypothetical protein